MAKRQDVISDRWALEGQWRGKALLVINVDRVQHRTSACPTPAVFNEAPVPRLCVKQLDQGARRYQKGSKCVQMLRVSLVI